MTPARLHRLVATVLILSGWSPGAATAADRGAATSGNWSDPTTWLGNAVPEAADRVYIGSTFPTGAASAATVSLTQNQSAQQVFLGNGAGTAGTLQLGNFNLTTGQLVLGNSAGGTATILRGTGTLAVSGTLTVNGAGGNTFTYAAGDVTGSLSLVSGGRATTSAAGNITRAVSVSGAGSRLTLGANLTTTAAFETLSVSGGGVLDARGFAISTPSSAGLSIGAGSSLLDRGTLAVGFLNVAGQPFALTPADAVGGFSLSGAAATTTLGAGVAVGGLGLSAGATAATTAAGNITGNASVSGAGSRLTLGANLTTTASFQTTSVSGGGVLDAQGFAITTPSSGRLDIAGGNGVTAPVLNVRTVTTGGYIQRGNSSVTLGAGDSAAGSLALSGDSTLAVNAVSGAVGRLTVTGTAANALSIEAGSRLALTLDGDVPGYALRWLDPATGDHVAELNSLIGSGAITITLTDGAQFSVFSDGSFTYVFQPVPEPAHLLLAAAGGMGLVRAVRRRARADATC